MKVLVLGLPGSGKTTQVDNIAREYNLEPIRMGNILREIAGTSSELGNKVKDIMATGALVDDGTVSEIIKEKINSLEDGFVMEGYPRTLEQVELFDPGFDKVFYLEVPIEVAKDRLMGRGRADDNAEAIETRLKVQMEDMETILENYQDKLKKIDGTKSVEEVFSEIKDSMA